MFNLKILLFLSFTLFFGGGCVYTIKPPDYAIQPFEVSVVKVSKGYIVATGVIINKEYVITANHFLKVAGGDGGVLVNSDQAEVIAINDELDLAVLKVKKGNLFRGAKLINGKYPPLGETIFLVGYPYGQYSIAKGGIYSYFEHDGVKRLEIDAEAFPGNSGGPIFNTKGEVVGILLFTKNNNHFGMGIISYEVLKWLREINIKI